ncbi:sugar ABC transporter permease (plasmid) [Parasedimentitalea marina]|uniref:Transport permease protein n=1 Tax=Parasedimentitalea marina TaxID=2483033 RepID=A0A3T0N9J1_9RHOB|nr:ABC transporter permease [Parasedimentitalea marina]AZV80696.1 sugar ABC transporter permease [Parasedimentitalea marina]
MSDLSQVRLRPVQPRLSSGRAITALMLREMSTTYGRSPGGYLWAVLEPAAGIALLVAIFSAGFRSPPMGTSFALFYASGMLPFTMFNDITNKMAQTIPFSRSLLEYPRVTFLDALLARYLLNALTHLIVHSIVVGAILLVTDASTTFDFTSIVFAYVLALSLAAGFGSLNAFLVLAYPLWQTIWSILTRPLFLISAIFFVFDDVPRPYSDFLWYNPLIHVVGQMREGFYPFYSPNYISPIYIFLVSGITCILGLFLLRRYHQDFLFR